jgi:hypothetical protein
MSKGSKRRPTDEQKFQDNWEAIFGKKEVKPTGWDNGLNQDYDRKLGQWFANQPGARQQVKETFETKEK